MYQPLIVDDEILVRIGLINCIDWEKHGFFSPLEAGNGKEAWEILQSNKIDIAIIDIKMPGMDGVELVEKIKGSELTTEIIMLSCYNDFEYVKKTMEMGACNYLFKPTMLPHDIIDAMDKAVDKIIKREQIDGKIMKLERKLEESIPLIKESFIRDVISGKNINKDQFNEKYSELEFNFAMTNISVMVVRIDGIDAVIDGKYNQDHSAAKSHALKIIEDALSSHDHYEVICKDIDEYLVILSSQGENSLDKTYKLCHAMADRVVNSIKSEWDISASIGISRGLHTIDKLKKAYEEASYSVDKRFFRGLGSINFYEDSPNPKDLDNQVIANMLEDLYGVDESKYSRVISDIFKFIKHNEFIKIEDVIEISSNIIGILLKSSMQYEEVIEELYNTENGIYSHLYNLNSIIEIEKFILDIADKIKDITGRIYNGEIYKAVQYIQKNLGNPDISLEVIAKNVNMSKSYLSRLFKEVTGERYIDYLTRLRVEKAQKLFLTTDKKVYEIAQEVGYSNWRYFTKVYKRYTGSTLSSLKRQLLNTKG